MISTLVQRSITTFRPAASRALRRLLVDDAELHPHRLGAGRDGLVDRFARGIGRRKMSTMSIGTPIWPSSRQTYSPCTCSPVICGLTGKHPVAVDLEDGRMTP